MEKKIIRLKEVDSTNAFLKNLGTYDEDALTIAIADYQTAGRGQGVHTWESEPGKNLLFSMMMCPKLGSFAPAVPPFRGWCARREGCS